ncbi:MAG: ribonuclease H-like domain-containing protein [Benjaminiella poitrasii]|nr:MAG: ribonuclease H-like domain-containing protein [Benjaminiella poitrasii]
MFKNTQEIPDPVQDFKAFQSSLFKSLVSATAAANSIPTEEVGFFRSLDRGFAKDLDQAGSNTLSIGNALLQQCAIDCGLVVKDFEDIDDVVERFGSVTDVCDSLLEKADICLDQLGGKSKQDDLKQAAPEVTQIATKDKLDYKFLHANNVIRPQMKFKDPVDNSNTTPFQRKIKYKPHALVPLDYTVTAEDKSLPHPYVYEINNLEYPERMFKVQEPEMYKPYDTTSATWVDTEEGLIEMMKHFEGVEELAIDLEHHNYRSYQGFTCLMQISTRDEDFIVDTLELRDKLWMLNEYFADPNITKVLHGADSDIIWLQRDFGLYVVNLFDTYFPTKVLDFPHHGLAYLLKKYCNYDADKKYQLADWRIRPLPEEMLAYARSDTHFLLYIYDCLRNELVNKSTSEDGNLVRFCLQKSNEVALQKYDKEVYDPITGRGPNGWKNVLLKWKYTMNPQQLAVFKALHSWRDHTARDEDESTRYILPNHMLMALVERMPTDSSGVIGCCNPCPTLVRMNAQAISYTIQKAKMEALLAPKDDAFNEEAKSATVEAKSTDNNGVVTTTMKVQQIRKKRPNVDSELFDLRKVRKIREETASKLEKQSSELFGSCF